MPDYRASNVIAELTALGPAIQALDANAKAAAESVPSAAANPSPSIPLEVPATGSAAPAGGLPLPIDTLLPKP